MVAWGKKPKITERPQATAVALEIIETLIHNKGDVNTRTLENEATPLVYAARWGETEIVEACLRNQGDEKARDSLGISGLEYARAGGYSDIVELLE